MSSLGFTEDGRPLKGSWPAEAFEGIAAKQAGQRAYENPYSAHREPDRFAAWRDGWEYEDERTEKEDEDGDGDDY